MDGLVTSRKNEYIKYQNIVIPVLYFTMSLKRRMDNGNEEEKVLIEIFKEPFGKIPCLKEKAKPKIAEIDSEEEFMTYWFPKKIYKFKYKRIAIDIQDLWKTPEKNTQNLVPMPEDPMLENFIKNFQSK